MKAQAASPEPSALSREEEQAEIIRRLEEVKLVRDLGGFDAELIRRLRAKHDRLRRRGLNTGFNVRRRDSANRLDDEDVHAGASAADSDAVQRVVG